MIIQFEYGERKIDIFNFFMKEQQYAFNGNPVECYKFVLLF